MNLVQLTSEEIDVLEDRSDIPLLEMIKGMGCDELKEFDVYLPTDTDHYLGIQVGWLEKERYLISQRPGHSPEVDELELVEDLEKNRNALRYKVWYVFKFPGMVERGE